MSQTSPTLALPFLQPSQAQKHVTHNEALKILDAATQLSVLAADLTDPPAAPAEADCYIPAPGATGDWVGHAGEIAIYVNGGRQFFAARQGWRADVIPTGATLRFDGSTWAPLTGDLQNLPEIGVNTTADAINRLAVAADATLLTHDGSGHQIKVNKASATDTASLLFQTGFSGRAEMGTTGSDDFAIKVSADGSTFSTALRVDHGTGQVAIGTAATDQTLSVAANAVEPTIQVRNMGGAGGAAFRMIDDVSTGDWKFKIKGDGSFKLRNQTAGVDILDIQNAPYTAIFQGPVRLPGYTVATLPDPAVAGAGAQVYVSDEAAGAVTAFSDGTNWRRSTDRVIVS
ncbi:DUF2793 domain-containing protein (plasmid) [Roseovarius faecimaris]|uniref:DUF2793 domain-containing protein n=1 Tax=Roseovarius faecimaris TaxID=2494550 RepID=A0A6I6IL44_9RHOB|nr:DUF2793 domain-containing protein [Roseovarius faecimaris]QGX96784.1 DUF2793 domain-containing protein [Roseovarius faecimaris]